MHHKKKHKSLFGNMVEPAIKRDLKGAITSKNGRPTKFVMWCIKYRWLFLIIGIFTFLIPVFIVFAVIGFEENRKLAKRHIE